MKKRETVRKVKKDNRMKEYGKISNLNHSLLRKYHSWFASTHSVKIESSLRKRNSWH